MADYVVLLRAIAHVPMQPFREALEQLGFTDVGSYGMSGNLLFNAGGADVTTLEQSITGHLGAIALVRSRREMAEVVVANPYSGRDGAALTFLQVEPDSASVDALEMVDFEGVRPCIVGRTVYHIYPTRPRGRRTSIDFERVLGVAGTTRSSRIVAEISRRMSA